MLTQERKKSNAREKRTKFPFSSSGHYEVGAYLDCLSIGASLSNKFGSASAKRRRDTPNLSL